jgi:hypothetical protein
VQRAAAIARELDAHDAVSASERGARELDERPAQQGRVGGRQAEGARIAHEPLHVAFGEARRARADPHARVAAARLRERRVVGAHRRGVGRAQRPVDPDRERDQRLSSGT